MPTIKIPKITDKDLKAFTDMADHRGNVESLNHDRDLLNNPSVEKETNSVANQPSTKLFLGILALLVIASLTVLAFANISQTSSIVSTVMLAATAVAAKVGPGGKLATDIVGTVIKRLAAPAKEKTAEKQNSLEDTIKTKEDLAKDEYQSANLKQTLNTILSEPILKTEDGNDTSLSDEQKTAIIETALELQHKGEGFDRTDTGKIIPNPEKLLTLAIEKAQKDGHLPDREINQEAKLKEQAKEVAKALSEATFAADDGQNISSPAIATDKTEQSSGKDR